MNKSIVYKIVNSVNGSVYIGQTTQGLARRKGEHLYRFNLGERNHRLYQAMRKYGIDHFTFEVICHAVKDEYLIELEVYFIHEYDSFNDGYNMVCGDDVCSETKETLSKAMRGRKITWMDKIIATKRKNGQFDSDKMRSHARCGSDSPLAKEFLIQHPCGKQEKIKGLNAFCKKHNLTIKCFYDIMAGKQHHHKGFKLLARLNDYS